jgi:hypothetical protein
METGFIDHFKTHIVAALNYSTIAELHTTAYAKSFQSDVSSQAIPW